LKYTNSAPEDYLFRDYFVIYNNNCFTAIVWVYPGEPVPEETFIHSHLSWSSTILSASYIYYDP